MTEESYESAALDNLTESQLRDELDNRGLETTGDREEMMARIEEYDQNYSQSGEHGEGGQEDGFDEDREQYMETQGENGDEEKEDENDFVVWADDDEINEDDKKAKKDGERQSSERHRNDDDKTPTELFSVDMAKEKDQLLLTWNGKRIVVPCKDEVSRELKSFARQLNMIAYPIFVADIYDESIIPLVKSAVNVSMELDEAGPGIPIKGYLRMKFGTISEMKNALNILNGLATEDRQITVQHFHDSDSEGHILSKVKGKGASKDSISQRLLFVSNIPADVTEEDLKNHFTDSSRIINPSKEDQHMGHVYVEYLCESDANEALGKYNKTNIKEQMLYVIKCLTERKESIGLLKDGLRKYWLEQVKSLESADKNSKSSKEVTELEQKLYKHKKRIVTDNAKRQQLGFPIPEDEQFKLDPEMETKEKEREREKEKERKSSSRRRSPPRSKRHSPPRRGRSTYRGPSKFNGPPRRGGGNPDALVNQLQHLVGVLSHKLPSESSRYDYHEREDRNYGDPRSRDRYHPYPAYQERSRFEGKRFASDDYGTDRKRRVDDNEYMRYERNHGDYRGFRGVPRW